MRVLKFFITGAVGLSVNLGIFHALYVLGVPYLIGSVIAFLIAIIVGFTLQKYWTFGDYSPKRVHTQFMQYAALALGNLALNTVIVYLLVEYALVHYLVAQTAGAGLVAFMSYLIYSRYIFMGTLDADETITE